MRDHEDPYILIERRGGFSAFVWGALFGAAAALLYAPRSGEGTRAELRRTANRLRDDAEARIRDARESIESALGELRSEVEERMDSARRAVESGREAARASGDDLRRRVRGSAAAFQSGYRAARTGDAEPAAPEPRGEEDEPTGA